MLVWDFCGACVQGQKTPWLLLSPNLWCQIIQRISLYFPLPLPLSPSLSRSHLFTTHCILLVCQSSCVHVVPINPQDLLLGRPMFHTQTHAQTRARTTVFPPSRICSIFPQESGGTHPISLILPVSSCLALKMCVWSLWDLLYHYSWTSLFLQLSAFFQWIFPAPNCSRPLVSACNIQIHLVFAPKKN